MILLLLFSQCSQDQKKGKGILSLFKRKIGTEYTDSTTIVQVLSAHTELKKNTDKVYNFYKRRHFELAWSEEGEFLPQAEMMVNLVHNVGSHGITPFSDPNLRQRYREVEHIRRKRKEEAVRKRNEMDVLLTGLYFEYADEIWKGKIANEEELGWHVHRKKIQEAKTLEYILSANEDSANKAFVLFEPLHPGYNLLKQSLAEYAKIKNAGGWPRVNIDAHASLKPGDTSLAVLDLKKRLFLTHDYPNSSSDKLFDKTLEAAVKKFQVRHGLEADGVVKDKTLKHLNVSVEERMKQIIVNMERWRWIPETLSPNYVWVNIPEFRLHVFEGSKEVWSMDVIVGKAASSTPIFNDEIEYIVFSPSWSIPEKIAVEELVPILKSDTAYINKHGMEILVNNKPVDPYTIDWNNLKEDEFRKYSFRQKPGESNPLGNVKFLFPNEYDVYLHDTPSDRLFKRVERDFSHGCIRLSEPVKFAEYLLKNDPRWTREKIESAMKSGTEQYVKLKEKEPVYLVYFTVWANADGTLNFREDIYDHDKKLIKLFFETKPSLP